jgi:hypothetical protein
MTTQTTDAATLGGIYPRTLEDLRERERGDACSIPSAVTIICFENCKGIRTIWEEVV